LLHAFRPYHQLDKSLAVTLRTREFLLVHMGPDVRAFLYNCHLQELGLDGYDTLQFVR
jgi:hypothetical protein